MEETFHPTDPARKQAIAALMQREDGPAIKRFVTQYGIFIGSAAIIVAAPHLGLPWWISSVVGVIYAIFSMGMFALIHETSHGTAFASKRLNRITALLAALPTHYVPSGFRHFHFAHHRHTHEHGVDPELTIAKFAAPGLTSNPFVYLGSLTGIPLFFVKLMLILGSAIGTPLGWRMLWFVPEKHRAEVSFEGRIVLLFHVAWVALGVTVAPGLLHLFFASILGHAFLQFVLMAEHHELPHGGAGKSALLHTRTTRTHPFIVWLMWHMPFHGEHHAYPAVPCHRLPELHKLLEGEKRPVGSGYLSYHFKVWRKFLTGRPVEAG
jgi:fatty acid desaturase